jgi:hypothetical protein
VTLSLFGDERRDTSHALRLGNRADRADLFEARVGVGSCDGSVRVEPAPLRGARDLTIGGDVFAFAEERLVQRRLERVQSSLLAGPQARSRGKRGLIKPPASSSL